MVGGRAPRRTRRRLAWNDRLTSAMEILMIAAPLLDRAGRSVVHVDDDWTAATKHEPLHITSGAD